jgi:hypothetical protein
MQLQPIIETEMTVANKREQWQDASKNPRGNRYHPGPSLGRELQSPRGSLSVGEVDIAAPA